MYVRYLKLRFLTHYGAQHYWSVSAVRAYGQTVVDKYQADWERVQEAKNAVADATQLQLEAQKEARAEGGEAVEAAEAHAPPAARGRMPVPPPPPPPPAPSPLPPCGAGRTTTCMVTIASVMNGR